MRRRLVYLSLCSLGEIVTLIFHFILDKNDDLVVFSVPSSLLCFSSVSLRRQAEIHRFGSLDLGQQCKGHDNTNTGDVNQKEAQHSIMLSSHVPRMDLMQVVYGFFC